ncbi:MULTISPECIES: hypothetical protein [Paenibacillus]|uniref:Uncharacterized protein n=1 Tax=Paenibacillus xylanilyticus TaxID=248903 RepID=A0A7Y6C2D4_9BACL|nr:hypothetical protein [Paenibacillus xylanilyticus]NUU79289.1 hypothetical protein [Paenibacillus xylanilyticus]
MSRNTFQSMFDSSQNKLLFSLWTGTCADKTTKKAAKLAAFNESMLLTLDSSLCFIVFMIS